MQLPRSDFAGAGEYLYLIDQPLFEDGIVGNDSLVKHFEGVVELLFRLFEDRSEVGRGHQADEFIFRKLHLRLFGLLRGFFEAAAVQLYAFGEALHLYGLDFILCGAQLLLLFKHALLCGREVADKQAAVGLVGGCGNAALKLKLPFGELCKGFLEAGICRHCFGIAALQRVVVAHNFFFGLCGLLSVLLSHFESCDLACLGSSDGAFQRGVLELKDIYCDGVGAAGTVARQDREVAVRGVAVEEIISHRREREAEILRFAPRLRGFIPFADEEVIAAHAEKAFGRIVELLAVV